MNRHYYKIYRNIGFYVKREINKNNINRDDINKLILQNLKEKENNLNKELYNEISKVFAGSALIYMGMNIYYYYH